MSSWAFVWIFVFCASLLANFSVCSRHCLFQGPPWYSHILSWSSGLCCLLLLWHLFSKKKRKMNVGLKCQGGPLAVRLFCLLHVEVLFCCTRRSAVSSGCSEPGWERWTEGTAPTPRLYPDWGIGSFAQHIAPSITIWSNCPQLPLWTFQMPFSWSHLSPNSFSFSSVLLPEQSRRWCNLAALHFYDVLSISKSTAPWNHVSLPPLHVTPPRNPVRLLPTGAVNSLLLGGLKRTVCPVCFSLSYTYDFVL